MPTRESTNTRDTLMGRSLYRERARTMSATAVQLGAIGRLGRFSALHARDVAVAWIVLAVGFGFLAPGVETALSGAGCEATGADSVAARSLIQCEFAGNASTGLMVVLHSSLLQASDASFAAVTTRTSTRQRQSLCVAEQAAVESPR